jgi:hypothetical protein
MLLFLSSLSYKNFRASRAPLMAGILSFYRPRAENTESGLLVGIRFPGEVGVHFAKIVPRVGFQAGLTGDAGRFGRVFFGIAGFLTVVFLPNCGDCIDGEESSVWTNLPYIN